MDEEHSASDLWAHNHCPSFSHEAVYTKPLKFVGMLVRVTELYKVSLEFTGESSLKPFNVDCLNMLTTSYS